MIRLSRAEWARLQGIRQWLGEQRHRFLQTQQAQEDPRIKAVLALIPEDMRNRMLTDIVEMQLTPVSHVKWLLAVLDRAGVEPK